MTYTPYYPGGWKDEPDTSTPIVAAALQNIENGIEGSMPAPSGTPSAGQVPVATGSGETSVWASPGVASLPLTTLGDTLYENATPTPVRLPGNTTTTRKFYRQQGTGSVSAAPAWDTLEAGDIPALPWQTSQVNAVTAYGADPTGTDDSTSAIQDALLSFGTLSSWSQGQGGIVYLPEGYYATSKPLIIPSGVTLKGSGWGTQITLTTGSGCDIIQWATYDSAAQAAILSVSASDIANAFWAGVRDLALHGEAFGATTAGYHHGINVTTSPLTTAASGDPDFDPCPTIENVRIEACTGDGYYHAGRSGAFLKRVLVQYCNGNGYTLSFDTTAVDCLAESALCGFYLDHGSIVGAGCKSYNNQDLTWVSGTSYTPGKVALYSGVLYFCISAVSGSTPPSSDGTHWTALSATSPQANGCGFYWDTNAGEHSWAAVDSQENSTHSYYIKGANTGPISINGTSSDPNFNNGQAAFNASNPDNYAHIAFDGVFGSNVQLGCNGTAADHMTDVTLLNSPGNNTLIMTTDGNETTQFSGGTPQGFTVLNGAVTGQLVISTALSAGTPGLLIEESSTYADFVLTGQLDAGQYSNFNLADDVYPLDAAGHYWSFSHRGDNSFLIYNYNGSYYTDILHLYETGEVATGNSTLDDGSGNASFTGEVQAADLTPTGLTGATAASRYVGATASGAPSSGTFAVGDFVIDQSGAVNVCTSAGSPGTWAKIVQRNSTDANIQPIGTAASAGSTFEAADAGHVHATNAHWVPADDGFIATFISPEAGMFSGAVPSSGIDNYYRVAIREPTTINYVIVGNNATAGSGTSSGCYVGLYTYSGGNLVRVAVSADCGSIFAAAPTYGGCFKVPLTAPYSASPGFLWIGTLFNLTTNPSINYMDPSTFRNGINAGNGGTANQRWGANTSDLTTLPTTVPWPGPTSYGDPYFAAVM